MYCTWWRELQPSMCLLKDRNTPRACTVCTKPLWAPNTDAASVWIFWISAKWSHCLVQLSALKGFFYKTGPTQYKERRHKVWNGDLCEKNKTREKVDVHKIKQHQSLRREKQSNIYSIKKLNSTAKNQIYFKDKFIKNKAN